MTPYKHLRESCSYKGFSDINNLDCSAMVQQGGTMKVSVSFEKWARAQKCNEYCGEAFAPYTVGSIDPMYTNFELDFCRLECGIGFVDGAADDAKVPNTPGKT